MEDFESLDSMGGDPVEAISARTRAAARGNGSETPLTLVQQYAIQAAVASIDLCIFLPKENAIRRNIKLEVMTVSGHCL